MLVLDFLENCTIEIETKFDDNSNCALIIFKMDGVKRIV